MTTLHIDFETRGVLDLREVGLHRYVRHPDTDVWCMAFAFNDDEPYLWAPEKPRLPAVVEQHVLNGWRVVAHNAPFELAVWNEICVPRYDWPSLKPEQTYCTMAQAYAMGLPGALEEAAYTLGLKFLKDTEGRNLMLRMARPRRIENGQPVWWSEPDKLVRLYEYCKQDVRVERELEKRLMPLSAYERRVWLMDYAINQRGVLADQETAKAALAMADIVKAAGCAEISTLTNGEVQTDTALIALKGWLKDHGVPAETLNKMDVVNLLETETLAPVVRRVLEIRQEIGKASVAKLKPMIERAGTDGRVRNTFQYHAAATGRWGGRGMQPHNFPRDMPDADEVESALALVRAGDYETLRLMYGPPLNVISRCLRSFLIAPPGKVLVGGDFSNVEGRGVAWISGEEWKLRAFRASDKGTGPGIYELTAAKINHIPVAEVTKKQRQETGKVPELAFGYGGGVGAFQTMSKNFGLTVAPEQADAWKDEWRAAHPATVRTWKQLEEAAKDAVRNPGETFGAGHGSRGVKFKVAGSFLWCRLPSGRCLCYPYPKLLMGRYGEELTYMTVPNAVDAQKGKVVVDPHNSPRWARVKTYGGSLMENVVQALCRDLMADVMLRLTDAGATIVLHVHDEIVIEVSEAKAEGARAGMEAIMNTPPAWAEDFPLFARCHVMRRYGK